MKLINAMKGNNYHWKKFCAARKLWAETAGYDINSSFALLLTFSRLQLGATEQQEDMSLALVLD